MSVKAAFQVIEKYKHLIKSSVLEVGSDRFEGSTAHFNDVCRGINKPFYSVDVEPGANDRAKSIIGDKAYLMKGEDFIRNVVPTLNTKFSFVFLDNFDFLIKSFKWEWEDHTKNVYDKLGMQLNNENSQSTHLEQTKLILPYLEEDGIIGFDDTWQKANGTFDGKGGTAVPWLIQNGFHVIEQGRVGEDIVGGYVVLTKLDVKLKIRVITCCKNEERMLPFFLQYYSSIANEILVFEGGSTDRSMQMLISCPKVTIISTGENNELDERELMKIRNEEYKKDREKWDWQIIVDIDEYLYHPNLLQKLQEYKLRGITLPLISGFEMLSSKFPIYHPKLTILNQITTGKKNDEWQAKHVIFNPKEVTMIYDFGCHKATYEGNVVKNELSELSLMHYRWISYDYFVNKNKYISDRLSEFNKSKGMGYHTTEHAKMSENEFNEKVKSAYDVFSLKLNIGCDTVILPKYVNIDPTNEKADLINDGFSLPYPDNFAIEIVSTNLIQSYNSNEVWEILKEWNRVLVVGGSLIIETYDLVSLCQAFVTMDDNRRHTLYPHFFSMPWITKKFNKFLFTENQLGYMLQQVGFRNIIRKASQMPVDKELALRMECVK